MNRPIRYRCHNKSGTDVAVNPVTPKFCRGNHFSLENTVLGTNVAVGKFCRTYIIIAELLCIWEIYIMYTSEFHVGLSLGGEVDAVCNFFCKSLNLPSTGRIIHFNHYQYQL